MVCGVANVKEQENRNLILGMDFSKPIIRLQLQRLRAKNFISLQINLKLI